METHNENTTSNDMEAVKGLVSTTEQRCFGNDLENDYEHTANDSRSDESDEHDFADEYVDDTGSFIGISIGKRQDEMKSPTTPAAAKAQVLDSSRDYFYTEPETLESQSPGHSSGESSSSERTPTIPTDGNFPPFTERHPPQPPSPSGLEVWDKPRVQTESRSSFVASILGSTSSRPRSSSGSSIIENIKKRLPSLTHESNKQNELSTNQNSSPVAATGQSSNSTNAVLATHSNTSGKQTPREAGDESTMTADETQSLLRSPTKTTTPDAEMQRLLRRATSDQSLYLRKTATGASQFDDYSAYANVNEMVNSRFKAITDSFQDSSLAHPKLLSISHQDDSGGNGYKSTNEPVRRSGSVQVAEASTAVPSSTKHPILKAALAKMTGDLVIMGGYRGSILREAQSPHRQLWVPIKVGMNLRKADLEVGLQREDELKMEDRIIPDGALSHIGPVDICRRLLRKCQKCSNVQEGKLRLHNYGYDWRLSPDYLSDRLIAFLETLPCNQSEVPIAQRGAWVVAHSLGGLLTRHVINRRPDLIAGVVYAGTPQNCVNILGPLRNGDDVLFSSRVLTAQVNFTLRTSYVLLPLNGRCFINKRTGERYDVDFFDVQTWHEHRLSPCISSPLSRVNKNKRTSIIGSISEAITQPGKHLSWFSSSSGEQSSSTEPLQQQVKDKAGDAADNIAGAAQAAKPDRPLPPTMASGSPQHHKPSIATQCTIPLPVATEYLSRTLQSVRQFKEELSHRASLQERNAYPPATLLFAKNTPTVYGAFVGSKDDISYDDAFDDLAFAAGDGVVLASAAQLPQGYRCVRNGRIESDRGHVGLLGDLEGVGKCLDALMDARACKVGYGAYESKTSR